VEYSRITLVLGAGASKAIHPEFGLGIELAEQILKRSQDPLLKILLIKKIGSNTPLKEFIDAFNEYHKYNRTGSIDHFISEVNEFPEFKEYRSDFNKIAAYSIVYHILGYEGRINNKDFQIKYPFQNSWMGVLIKWMKNIHFFKFKFSERFLKIVTFNYDRTFENLLFLNFPDETKQVNEFIRNSVVHVYGHVGDLPQMNSLKTVVQFGADNDNIENWNVKELRLLFDERNDAQQEITFARLFLSTLEDEELEKLDASITRFSSHEDQQICFFGFAFDSINCARLNLTANTKNKPKFFANIHPVLPDEGFVYRRQFAEMLRSIIIYFKISFLKEDEFIKERLEETSTKYWK
jgi:hypothetical protein